MTSKKKVFIFGSHASRKALSELEQHEQVQVVLNVTRTSLASQMYRGCHDQALLKKTGAAQGRLKFDFYKTVFYRMTNDDYDIALLDFVDERFHIYEWRQREFLTASPELVKATAPEKPHRIIRFDSAEYEKYWMLGLQKMIEQLEHAGKLNKLRINRFWLPDNSEFNQTLQRRYDMAEMLLGPDVFIDYPEGQSTAQHFAEYVKQDGRLQIAPAKVNFSVKNHLYFSAKLEYAATNPNTEYACYLYRDDECVEQQHYQSSLEFSFSRPLAAGSYQVKLFMRAKSGAIIAINSEKIDLEKMPEPALRGAKFIEYNEYQIPGFDNVTFTAPYDWAIDPFNNRTWRWNLLQLNVLPQLQSYDQFAQSHEGLLRSIELVISWQQQFSYDINHPEAWHDHCTAMRGSHLLGLYRHIQDANQNSQLTEVSEFLPQLLQLLQLHAERLSCNEFYSAGTNHGFDQALILGQIAEVLPEGEDKHHYRQLARERIASELNTAFASDGGHVENSPAYLNYGLKQALQALPVLHAEDPEDHDHLEQQLIERVERSIEALAHMIKPDGTLPIIGDTQALPVKNFLRPYQQQFKNYGQFLYAHTEGRRGTQPERNALVLPQSGYAIMRDAWQQRTYFKLAMHLVMKCGFLSNYHRHDDDLHFVLMAKGIDWFVDGGLYNYHEQEPQRRHLRSPKAHNISMPLGARASRDLASASAQLKQTDSEFEDGSAVIAESNMFRGFLSTRKIDYGRKQKTVIIHDRIIVQSDDAKSRVEQQQANGETTFVTRFQVPAEHQVKVHGSDVEIKQGNVSLWLKPRTENHQAMSPVIYPAGQTDQPSIWYSSQLGRLAPVIVVEYRHYTSDFDAHFAIDLP